MFLAQVYHDFENLGDQPSSCRSLLCVFVLAFPCVAVGMQGPWSGLDLGPHRLDNLNLSRDGCLLTK